MEKRAVEEFQESSSEGSSFSSKRIKREVKDDFQDDVFEIPRHFEQVDVLSSQKDEFKHESSESDEEDGRFLNINTNRNLCLYVRKAASKPCSQLLRKIIFLKSPGLKKYPNGTAPIDFFDYLLTDEFYDFTIEQSNLNINTKNNSLSVPLKSGTKNFTKSELRKFIGLILHMGTIKILKFEDYWKKTSLFNFSCFSRHMSQARFTYFLQYLCFSQSSKSADHNYDRYQKVNWIVHYFNKKMEEIYYPKQQLFVNEAVSLEEEKLDYFSEIPHVKLYLLSEKNGPVLRMMANTEKDVTTVREQSKVVFNLMKGLLDNGHSLFLNSRFASLTLTSNLLGRNTYCTGILSERRRINILNESKLNKGDVSWIVSDDIVIGKWRSEFDVFFISSEYPADIIVDGEKSGNVTRPIAVNELNKMEEEAEKNNKLLNLFAAEKNNLSWDKKMAIHMIEILLLNAWHLYNMDRKKIFSFYDFRLLVINNLLSFKSTNYASVNEEMVENDNEDSVENNLCDSVETETDPLAIDPLHMNLHNHFPSKRKVRKRCRQCYKMGKRKDTNIYCGLCSGEPGLCLDPCFRQYRHQM